MRILTFTEVNFSAKITVALAAKKPKYQTKERVPRFDCLGF